MLSTLATYQMVSKNLSQWQAMTKATPAVATATGYFQQNIGSVKSISDFINNPRLFNYAMTAFGLGDMTYAKGLMQKILEGGVKNSNSLANTMSDPRYRAFAKAFDFAGKGVSSVTSSANVQTVVNNYVQQATETNIGQQDGAGAQMALYFQRLAPTITSGYQILADKNLLTVAQTALGISPQTGTQNVATQAATFDSKINYKDFKDPTKLNAFLQRFAALYDASNNNAAASNPALAILSSSSSSSSTISTNLLASIQSLTLGGVPSSTANNPAVTVLTGIASSLSSNKNNNNNNGGLDTSVLNSINNLTYNGG